MMDDRLGEDPLIPELLPDVDDDGCGGALADAPSQNREIDAILRQLQRLAVHPGADGAAAYDSDDGDDEPCRFGSDPGLMRVVPGATATLRPPAYRPLCAPACEPLAPLDFGLDAAPFAPPATSTLALPALSLRSPTQTPGVSPPLVFGLRSPQPLHMPLQQQQQQQQQRQQGPPRGGHGHGDYLLEPPPESERLPPHLWPSGTRDTLYRTKPCAYYFHTGHCQKGDRCNFSHELLPGMEVPPLPANAPSPAGRPIALGSTPLATTPRSPAGTATGTCAAAASPPPRRPHHADAELPPAAAQPFFRTKPCRFFFEKGACLKGDHCNFSHDPASLQAPQPQVQTQAPPSQPQAVPLPGGMLASCSAPPQVLDGSARYYRSARPVPVHIPPQSPRVPLPPHFR